MSACGGGASLRAAGAAGHTREPVLRLRQDALADAADGDGNEPGPGVGAVQGRIASPLLGSWPQPRSSGLRHPREPTTAPPDANQPEPPTGPLNPHPPAEAQPSHGHSPQRPVVGQVPSPTLTACGGADRPAGLLGTSAGILVSRAPETSCMKSALSGLADLCLGSVGGAQMYFRLAPRKRRDLTYTHLQLVEASRENGKNRQRVLYPFGNAEELRASAMWATPRATRRRTWQAAKRLSHGARVRERSRHARCALRLLLVRSAGRRGSPPGPRPPCSTPRPTATPHPRGGEHHRRPRPVDPRPPNSASPAGPQGGGHRAATDRPGRRPAATRRLAKTPECSVRQSQGASESQGFSEPNSQSCGSQGQSAS